MMMKVEARTANEMDLLKKRTIIQIYIIVSAIPTLHSFSLMQSATLGKYTKAPKTTLANNRVNRRRSCQYLMPSSLVKPGGDVHLIRKFLNFES